MKKTWHSLKNRVTAMLLALICVLGLLPTTALAAGADTIKLERFGMSGVSYQSASLGRCTMHQMYFGVAGKSSVGFGLPQVWPIREVPMPPPFVPQKPTEVFPATP